MPVALSAAEDRSSTWFSDTIARVPESGIDLETGSRCQWMSTAAAFVDTGGLVSGDELADLMRQQCDRCESLQSIQPMSLVARWIVSRAVVTIESPWGHLLPMFQFEMDRAALHPAMPMVLAELQGVLEGAELALWFVTPNEWLGGERPAVAMHTTLPAVRHAARADRYVALGG